MCTPAVYMKSTNPHYLKKKKSKSHLYIDIHENETCDISKQFQQAPIQIL